MTGHPTATRRARHLLATFAAVLAVAAGSGVSEAAGTLTPKGAPHRPIQLRDHAVTVVINNGFARTMVEQTFFNPNDIDLEAVYAFPLPKSASLAELVIFAGEREIHGEVLERQRAAQVYQEERDQGNDAGLARQNGYQTFEFAVSPVRAGQQTRIRFVYYQPLEIDAGVGRYLYPLEDGGTDEMAQAFWTRGERVEGTFSADIELKSAWPIDDVRVPGFAGDAEIVEVGENHHRIRIERQDVELNRDLVVYYRLADNLPGRVELLAYRPDAQQPGTFMMVVTPGIDLKPITTGADYALVLDLSGSMAGKLDMMVRGVTAALADLSPDDRVRIVTFQNQARVLTPDWVPATPDNVERLTQQLQQLRTGGSTNLYDGLSLALASLDDDRATSVLLVTDAVTNTGIVDPKAFHELTTRHDVRIFSFLMGNNANWPLMRTLAEGSGGFWTAVSNADDVVGQLLLAKSKIRYESLHGVELAVRGVRTFEATDEVVGKVYRGQQLVVFGRYERGGPATVQLTARLTGEDRTYTTAFDFPAVATDHPEIERLWALDRIETIQASRDIGYLDPEEARASVVDLALAYQLVTDETSMVALADEAFDRRGIERRNRQRVGIEHQAQAVRAGQPARSARVDQGSPMFTQPAPSVDGSGGRGSGAIDPVSGTLALGAGLWALMERRRRARASREL